LELYELLFLFILNNHKDVDLAHLRQLDSLEEEALLALAVSHAPLSFVSNKFAGVGSLPGHVI